MNHAAGTSRPGLGAVLSGMDDEPLSKIVADIVDMTNQLAAAMGYDEAQMLRWALGMPSNVDIPPPGQEPAYRVRGDDNLG